MNVYDFDQTIYYPDSSYHFFVHCLKKHPAAVLPVIPKALILALRYRRGRIKAAELKEHLFSFLPRLKDVDEEVRVFWETHRGHVQSWYLRRKRDDDLIISASPEFLLRPIAEELGVRLIATPMDKGSGRIEGENCHDHAKVRRYRELYEEEEIEEFYSDSLSDAPLAELSKRAFLVRKDQISNWPGK